MQSVVVFTTLNSMNPALLGLTHLATVITNGVYVWCWGETNAGFWQKAAEGEPATCLQCWVLGPKEGWKASRMFGVPEQWEMHEGKRWLVLDTETKLR